jgi:DAK2 domain fusion protein YloV
MTEADQTRAWRRLAQRYRYIDARLLIRLMEAGLTWLRTNQDTVNQLNVYPVPDGDTGTNMTLTMQSAMDELQEINSRSIGGALQALAQGALMGARGNSGVILSQLWRGFARALEEIEEMDAQAFVAGLAEARDTAYRGVGKPVEGTILTVSKDIASAAEQALGNGADSNLDVLSTVVEAADASVENTPNLLDVLAKAGVVDAGGKGLFFILEGMLRAAQGLALDQPLVTIDVDLERILSVEDEIEEGQDWEVVVDLRPNSDFDMQHFTTGLAEMGVSLQLAEGDAVVRMHIHVPDTTEYEPIEYSKRFGTITNVHIENLMDQLDARAAPQLELREIEPGQIAVVAVASGAGWSQVFASIGAAAVVGGGQTMNPSTEQILESVDTLATDKVVVLPNNKNIILAAEQAAKLSDKEVVVLPTRSMPQGITALFNYDPEDELRAVAERMEAALGEVRTGELVAAIRDATFDDIDVKEGQMMALLDDKLVATGADLQEATVALLQQAGASEAELITVYRGSLSSTEEAAAILELLEEEFPDQEIELVEGGQPHCNLILSVE